MDYLKEFLLFLGGGSLSSLLTYFATKRKDNRITSDTLIKDIYKEIGRLNLKVEELETERDELDKKVLLLREENILLRNDNKELRNDNKELKEKLKAFLEQKKEE